MRVAFIEPAGKGGMIHYAFQLCRAMAKSADVTLITSTDYELSSLPQPFRVEPTIALWDAKPSGRMSMTPWAVLARKVRRIGRAWTYYREWLRVIRRVADVDADLVLLGDIRFPFDLFPLMLLRRRVRRLADICHNVHPFSAGGKSGGLFDRSGWQRHFYRRIYHLFDHVFVHFRRNQQEFLESFGVAPSRVSAIVHGNEAIFEDLRDPRVSGTTIRSRHALGESPVILFFGTLSKYKGTDVLLEAFGRVHRQSGARLVLAGFPFHDFDLAAHQAIAATHGVERAVTWVPEYVDSGEVAAWMELAAVIVFPYRDIYQSGALHVAQTFGVPIVASAIGAMQDVIEHDESGLLVPAQNADALAAAILRLLNDPGLARRLGEQAAADARSRFSWESIAATILDASAADELPATGAFRAGRSTASKPAS